jgi:predicted patatin/cPLA2 family phospholipase
MQPTPFDVLRARRAGTAGDEHRVALVVEGGCMRGVIAAGAVTALDHLDLAQRFDAVYGVSAGALNAAYMLAGQAALGTSIYFEDLPAARFVSRRRMLAGRRPIALDYTIDEIVGYRKRLDVAAVQAAAPEFHVLATCLEHRSLHRPHGLLSEQLRAAARVPLLAGPPVHLNGCRLYDGGLLDPLPVDLALQDGATHVVVLRTRPDSPSVMRHRHVESAMLAWLRRAHPETRSMPVMPGDRYKRLLAELPAGVTARGDAVVQVLVPPGPAISQSEMNPATLRIGAWSGLATVEDAVEETVDRARLYAHGWQQIQDRETESWVRARTASRDGIAKHTANAAREATALITNAPVNPDSAG